MEKLVLSVLLFFALCVPASAYRDMYSDIAISTYPKLIPGATVSVFLAGTNTAATIYSSFTSTTAAHSVTTSADGIFTFYVDRFTYDSDQTFKLVITKTNYTTIITDNVAVYRHVLGTYNITADQTVTTLVRIPKGVVYNISSGKTLTFSLMPIYGDYTVFSGAGSVSLPATSGNAFASVSVSGQTTVTAASPTQNIELVAGSGMTITTSNSAKTVTLESSGGTGGPHNILSTTHSDAAGATSVTAGALLYGNATPKWDLLSKGTAYQALGMNSGATLPEWQASVRSTLTAAGDLVYASSANILARLAKGTAYQALQMNSGATAPSWQASATSVLTTGGDVLYASAANTLARLALGSYAGQIMRINDAATAPAWSTVTIPNTIAAGSVVVAQSANTIFALTSTSGTKYLKNVNGTMSWDTSTSSATAAGSDTQIQYNDGGYINGDAAFAFDKTLKKVWDGATASIYGESSTPVPSRRFSLVDGTSGSPITTGKSTMHVEKFTSFSPSGDDNESAATFAINKISSTNTHGWASGVTGIGRIQAAATGEMHGVYGMAINDDTGTATEYKGIWGLVGVTNDLGVAQFNFGCEVDVLASTAAVRSLKGDAPFSGGYSALNRSTTAALNAAFFATPKRSNSGYFHTGLLIPQEAIYPGYEAVWIGGSYDTGNKINGIVFGYDGTALKGSYFNVGIDFSAATFAAGAMLLSRSTYIDLRSEESGKYYIRSGASADSVQIVANAAYSAHFYSTGVTVPGGIVAGSPTGGNKGNGTINAETIYVQGEAVGSGGMVYPSGSGIPIVSGGVAWGTTITNYSANWNAAYGWGNHAAQGYLKNIVEDTTPQLGGNLDVNGKAIVAKDSGAGDYYIYASGNATAGHYNVFRIDGGSMGMGALNVQYQQDNKIMGLYHNGSDAYINTTYGGLRLNPANGYLYIGSAGPVTFCENDSCGVGFRCMKVPNL